MRYRVAKVAIIRRVARMEVGLFGDCKRLRDGVWELRVDVGAGYRVYYAHVGGRVVLLTSGGDQKGVRVINSGKIGCLKFAER